jgi:tetratricopeptide (TPR) repeat protein
MGNRGYEDALKDFNRALELKADFADAYTWRGYIYDEWGDYDKALADYNLAINLKPDSASQYRNRGLLYKEKGKYAEALADYTQSINLNPSDSITYYRRAQIYKEQREYEKAIEDYTHIIALVPSKPDAYEDRAKLYETMGEYSKTIEDYRLIIKLFLKERQYYAEQVEKYDKLDPLKRAEYEGAFRDAAVAVRKNPNDAEAHLARAVSYENLGGDAIKYYDSAIEIKPDFFDAYYARGLYNKARGEYYDAFADFTETIKINPQSAKAYYERGRLLFVHKGSYFSHRDSAGRATSYNWAAAAEDFTRVIELEPSKAAGYFSRGYAYRKLGRDWNEKAIADYTRTIEISSDWSGAYNNRALIYAEIKEYDKALADYDEAIKINPKDPMFYENRGYTLHKLHKYEAAIADFTEAIKLNPNDADLYVGRSKVYESMDLYTLAIKDAKDATDIDRKRGGRQLAHLEESVNEYEFGLEALANRDYKEAVRLFSIAVIKYPDDAAWAYMDRAKAYRALGDVINAEKDEKKAELYDSVRNSEVFKRSASLKVEELTKTIKREPNNQEAYLNRARAYRDAHEYKKAIADIDKMFELAGEGKDGVEIAKAHMLRAWCLLNLDDYERAAADAKRACELESGYSYCEWSEYMNAYNEGTKALKNNDYNAVISHWSVVLKILPENPDAYAARAKAYKALGDAENARKDEAKAKELNESYALMEEIKFPATKTEKEKEIEVFSNFIKEASDTPETYNLRGLSYYKYGDYKNAEADFSQAIKLNSKYAVAYNNRAITYAALNDIKKAAKDAKKACELGECGAQEILKTLDESNKAAAANPKDAKAYNDRAKVYMFLNNIKQAEADAKIACELGECEALEALKERLKDE